MSDTSKRPQQSEAVRDGSLPLSFIRTDAAFTAEAVEKAGASGGSLAGAEQPEPRANGLPGVWGLVVEDMRTRDALGAKKYGTPLQPFNGRDALVDAYQEALDLVVYLRQAIYERDSK